MAKTSAKLFISPRGFPTLSRPADIPITIGTVVKIEGTEFPVRFMIADLTKNTVTAVVGVTPLQRQIIESKTEEEIADLNQQIEETQTLTPLQHLTRSELESKYGFQDELDSLLG